MKTLDSELKQTGFNKIEDEGVLAEDNFFWVVPDKYPLSPGHTLVIAKSKKSRFEQLNFQEKLSLLNWIDWTVKYLNKHLSPKPDGFNMGLNDGAVAGQTKKQFHFHVIPRFSGDCADPRGGIRNILPEKAKYW
jgi:diadenosine tetraphosphate (Ap4A) HIT family hydrolase